MSFYVYALSDPETGEVRYVGKTQRKLHARLSSHRVAAKTTKNHLYNWWRSLNNEPALEVIEECSGPAQLDDAERFFISYFRSLGFSLTNLTDGGEGTPGRILSAATREKTRAKLIGHTVSTEAREKMRAAKLGKKQSPEHAAKSRQAAIKRWSSTHGN